MFQKALSHGGGDPVPIEGFMNQERMKSVDTLSFMPIEERTSDSLTLTLTLTLTATLTLTLTLTAMLTLILIGIRTLNLHITLSLIIGGPCETPSVRHGLCPVYLYAWGA